MVILVTIIERKIYQKGWAFDIEAHFKNKIIGEIQLSAIHNQRKDISVDNSFIDEDWFGTGLGQLMYDKAIRVSKDKGYRYFVSDDVLDMTKYGKKAWERLSQRYQVMKPDKNRRIYSTHYMIRL